MGSSSDIASYHLTVIPEGRRGALGSKPRLYEVEEVDDFVPESVDAGLDDDSGVDAFGAGSDAAGLESFDVSDSAGLLSDDALLAAFGA